MSSAIENARCVSRDTLDCPGCVLLGHRLPASPPVLAIVGLPSDIGGLGVRSDQLLRPPSTTYHPGPGAVAVVVGERPDYWLGNLLVLDAIPGVDAVWHWRERWTSEVAARSGARHSLVHFEVPWCKRESALSHPVPPSIEVEWDTVFQAPATIESRGSISGSVRQLTGESDWTHSAACSRSMRSIRQRLAAAESGRLTFYAGGLTVPAARAGGAAAMFGVWRDAALVGAAGLLWDPEIGVARYQAVVTHPAHRRQGICRTLLSHTHRHVADRGWPVVLVATHRSTQEALYTSFGFEPVSLRGTWHLPEVT